MPEKRIVCPYCGYVMPVRILPAAICRGLTIRCKNRGCKKEFEMIVQGGKQSR